MKKLKKKKEKKKAENIAQKEKYYTHMKNNKI